MKTEKATVHSPMNAPHTNNEADIRHALAVLKNETEVFEIRALDAKLNGGYKTGTVSGYFNRTDTCISELRKITAAKGVYITLNEINPALFARRSNRLDYFGTSTSDRDVVRRNWLLIDIDAVRPSEISASEAEKQSAIELSRKIYKTLKERGWPEPLVCDSGNGWHLLYRVDLPAPDEGLIERVLCAIAERFDTDKVKIDRTVFNPARIVRLYGTIAAKGDSTADRPHRLSRLSTAPAKLESVSEAQLQELVDEWLPKPVTTVAAKSNGQALFDMEAYLSRIGVAWKQKDTGRDGVSKWILEKCPFCENGAKDAAVFLTPEGVRGFKCFHNSCTDLKWKEFRAKLDPFDPAAYSRANKAEYVASLTSTSTQFPDSRGETVNIVDVDVPELPKTPKPYTSPPLDLLPPTLREYVETAAIARNVDTAWILLPLLSSLASTIGHSRSIALKDDYTEPPIIWTAIIGRSGQGKSPAINDGCYAVMKRDRQLQKENKDAAARYENDLAEWESTGRKKGERKPGPIKPMTCIADDITLEKLAETIHDNPRGVLGRKDELSAWFASFDQYTNAKGADVSKWLSLHTGSFLGVDRRSEQRSYRIHNPRVCLTGGIQPDVLKRALTQDYFERGLPARILFAAPPVRQAKWSETSVPGCLYDAVWNLFDGLWLLQPGRDEYDNPEPARLALTPDAKAMFVAYFNECGAAAMKADEREGAAWHKLSAYAARFTLVGQLAGDPQSEVVNAEVMQGACDLARWFGAEAGRIYEAFSETPAEREQRQLVEFIEKHGGLVSLREVTNYCWAFKNQTDKVAQMLNALHKADLGEWVEIKPDGRGRPTRKFRLSPASTSTKIPGLLGKTPNYVDVDAPSSLQNAAFREHEPAEMDDVCSGMTNRDCRCKRCEDFRQSKWVYPSNEPEWFQLFPGETQEHWRDAFKAASVKLCEVCGEPGLFNDPCQPDTHYWFNIKSHAVRCQSCQETHWWAEGYQVEDGLPYCWNHKHTREERIAERQRDQLQKAAACRARAEDGTAQAWYAVLFAQEPEETRQAIGQLDAKERRGHVMTAGEFLAEATALFNATPEA